ncbi:hypothetical protein V8E55_004244 [Tylopilus felleus]
MFVLCVLVHRMYLVTSLCCTPIQCIAHLFSTKFTLSQTLSHWPPHVEPSKSQHWTYSMPSCSMYSKTLEKWDPVRPFPLRTIAEREQFKVIRAMSSVCSSRPHLALIRNLSILFVCRLRLSRSSPIFDECPLTWQILRFLSSITFFSRS